MINPEPSGIVTPVRQLTDAEFADLKAKWLARHSAVNQVVVLPDPHYDPTFSQFIRSACCDAPVYQVEDFAAECLPVLCGSCGAIAGTPGREDVDALVGGP